MILYVDIESIFEYLSETQKEFLISELTHCAISANHLVVVTRKSCEIMLGCNASNLQRATINAWALSFAEDAALLERVSAYMRLTGACEEDAKAIDVSIGEICNGLLRRPTVLLTENSSRDGKLLRELLLAARRARSLPDINLDLDHGGGTAIVDRAGFWADKDSVVIVVTDSDLKSPKWKKSVTNRKIEAKFQGRTRTKLFILPVHEIENLLLIESIRLLDEWTAYPCKDIVTSMFEMHVSNKCDLWKYFDFKNGITHETITEIAQVGDSEWLDGCLSRYGAGTIASLGKDLIRNTLDSNVAIATLYNGTRIWPEYIRNFIYEVQDWFIAPRRNQLR